MNLLNGKYQKYEIYAFSGCKKSMWLVVYDGKYNYMLFDSVPKAIRTRYRHNRMPCNGISGLKQVEYYSTFENALGNLVKVVALHKKITK